MDVSSQGHLEKPLLDTLERVRGLIHQTVQMENPKLREYFLAYAELEGRPDGQTIPFSREISD